MFEATTFVGKAAVIKKMFIGNSVHKDFMTRNNEAQILQSKNFSMLNCFIPT